MDGPENVEELAGPSQSCASAYCGTDGWYIPDNFIPSRKSQLQWLSSVWLSCIIDSAVSAQLALTPFH